MQRCVRILVVVGRYLWAAPASIVGLALGAAAIAAGASVTRVGGVIEIGGGAIGRRLASGSRPVAFVAITFGHVVLGVDRRGIDSSRAHERVHVHQYERWGVLFFPLYLGASALAWLRGGDAYRDNPFEREAVRLAQFEGSASARSDRHGGVADA